MPARTAENGVHATAPRESAFGAHFAHRLDVAISSVTNPDASDRDAEGSSRSVQADPSADDRSGIRLRPPLVFPDGGDVPSDDPGDDAPPPPAPEEASSGPLILPPRPSWITAPALPPIPKDEPFSLQEDVITVVDRRRGALPLAGVGRPGLARLARPARDSANAVLWGSVCGVTFLMAFSIGRLLLGF